MTQSNISYLQIVEMVSPSTVDEFRERGYGQFKVQFKDPKTNKMRRCRLNGRPDTCCPSFIMSGTFTCMELRNGLLLKTNAKNHYTYRYKNPGKVTQQDVNYFVKELDMTTQASQADRDAMFAIVPCSVEVFKSLEQFERLDMGTRCEFFRAEYEMKIRVAFPSQMRAIHKMNVEQLRAVYSLLDGLIWKLWFERYIKPLGLKEMTAKGYNDYKRQFPRDKPLPEMYTLAFRIYQFIKEMREAHGHDIFPKAGLFQAFKSNERWFYGCTLEQFEVAMKFLLAQGLSDVHLDHFVAFPKDVRANLITVEALSRLAGTPLPRMRGREVPCMPSAHLTDRQREFIQHVFNNPITLLQGPPGTGKTEGLVGIMAHFATPLVVTYGGRMVCALQERFGKREETAHTIHHVCCVQEFNQEKGHAWLSQYDMLVIDEGSNVDARLFSRLLYHMREHIKRLVIVGDIGQIFPIKPGCPFHDLIHAFPQHCFVLNENKRVDPDARQLADVSAMINRGELPAEVFGVSAALQLHENADRAAFEEIFGQYVQQDSVMDVQIVTLRNKERNMLNQWAEEYLLTQGLLVKRGNVIRLGLFEYYPGKKIMFTKNNNNPEGGYKNGELGEILSIANNPVRITLTNGKTVAITDISDICPGYATTCNKAQGSEWKHIIFWVPENNGFFSREHAYVAVSRAKKHCHVMLNALKDLQRLVSRKANRRRTLLAFLLEREGLPNLADMHAYDAIELKNPQHLKLLPMDCAAVPVYQPVDDAQTTKKDKKRKLSNTAGTKVKF